jgi:hypothetical protein
VRSNRDLYRSCPKHTKLLVSKAIVQAVQQQNPQGRFLEITKQDNGLWKQIPYKRAVDKTSQALREKEMGKDDQDSLAALTTNMPIGLKGRPKGDIRQGEAAAEQERTNDMNEITKMTLAQAGLEANNGPDYKGPVVSVADAPQAVAAATATSRKRKSAPAEFIKPSWWSKGSPATKKTTKQPTTKKKTKQEEEEEVPLTEPLQIRQTSMFRFLSEATGIFGRSPSVTPSAQINNDMQSSSGFAFGRHPGNNDPNQNQNRNNQGMNMGQSAAVARVYDEEMRKGRSSACYEELLQDQVQSRRDSHNNIDTNTNMRGSFSQQHQQSQQQQQQSSSMGENSVMSDNRIAEFQPFPVPHVNGGYNNNNNNNMGQQGNMYGNYNPTMQNNMGAGGIYHPQPSGDMNNSQQIIPPYAAAAPPREQEAAVPPPMNRLTTQVSDWLNSFWPLGKDGLPEEPKEETPPPPPVLEPGMSSTFMDLVRTPSRLLTSLKSGVTSMLFAEMNSNNDDNDINNSNHSSQDLGQSVVPPPPSNNMAPHMLGNATAQRRDSLLEDYEETPLEKSLRSVSSR